MKKTLLLTSILSLSFSFFSCKKSSSPKTAEEHAKQEFSDELNQHRKELKEKFAENGGILNDSKHSEKLVGSSKKLVEKTTGESAMLARVQLKLFEKLHSVNSSLRKKQSLLSQAFDFSSIKTVTDANDSIEKVASYLEKSKQVKKFYSSQVRQFTIDTLNSEKLHNQVKANFLRGFDDSSKANTANIIKIREHDEIICEQVTIQINLLKDNLGRWNYDKESETLDFTEDMDVSVIKQFNAAALKIQQTATKQLNIQKSMLDNR